MVLLLVAVAEEIVILTVGPDMADNEGGRGRRSFQ